MYTNRLHIAHSARKHGVSDADMHHAAKHFVVEMYHHDGETGALLHLIQGPAVNGLMLELVIVDPLDPQEATIIHAMRARKKFAIRAEEQKG
jgi:hypothetical protein